MTITLLLDLDDTLLDTNMQAFVPAYFSALASALAGSVSPEVMLPALMGGTKAMMQNENPSLTLREVFDAHFYPKLGLERAALQQEIDSFYNETFPTLSHVASQRPEAVEFVRWAFEAGHRVAIATNPYFPLKAVQHRMRWAGLPPEEYDFALVSSYETFHFTKEIAAYFPEFLAQLGWPEGPVVMVGNDLEMDLLPARQAGLPVFWKRAGQDDGHPDIPQGSFTDLRVWLAAADPVSITPTFSTPESILNILHSTPAALASLVNSLPPAAWEHHPEPGEWCLTEILCHLRDVETDVNLPRIQKLLAEDNPFLPGVVSDDWVHARNYAAQDGRFALADFMEARKGLIVLLNGEQAKGSRPARHAIFGPTTLLELAGFMAGHDRAHVQQIWKTIRA
ncbi:MAG: DinB family protein [Chloroflexi bacterium]|nr:DinB family protein [Chloroflexota bacterium]